MSNLDVSIEPRLFSRGYTAIVAGNSMVEGSFNRATAFQPVSYTHLDVYKRQVFASIEPRLFSRGYPRSWPFRAIRMKLQSSHGFSAVDTKRSCRSGHPGTSFNRATAFQPWICLLYTSEPRLFSRGYTKPRPLQHGLKKLQWSHGFSAVDTQNRALCSLSLIHILSNGGD